MHVFTVSDTTLEGLDKLYFPEIDQFIYIPSGRFIIDLNGKILNTGEYNISSIFDIDNSFLQNYADIDIYPLESSGIVNEFGPWYELSEANQEDWCLNFLRNTNHISVGINKGDGIVGIEIGYFYKFMNGIAHDTVIQSIDDEDYGFLKLLKKFRKEGGT